MHKRVELPEVSYIFSFVFHLVDSPLPRRSSMPFVSGNQKSTSGRTKAARSTPNKLGSRKGYLEFCSQSRGEV